MRSPTTLEKEEIEALVAGGRVRSMDGAPTVQGKEVATSVRVVRWEDVQALDNDDDQRRQFFDNAGKRIPTDVIVVTNNVAAVVDAIIKQDGRVTSVGARTSATDNFTSTELDETTQLVPNLVGVQGIQTLEPKTSVLAEGQEFPDSLLESNEIVVDPQSKRYRFGCAVTVDQLNAALNDARSSINAAHGKTGKRKPAYFLPVDLTTKGTAYIAAVLATAAQGPNRRHLAQFLTRVVYHDGKGVRVLTKTEDIKALLSGMWGVTGSIIEMEAEMVERPAQPFNVFCVIKDANRENYGEKLARIQAIADPGMRTKYRAGVMEQIDDHLPENERVPTGLPEGCFINGVEETSRYGLAPFGIPKIMPLAQEYVDKMDAANSDFGFTIGGYMPEGMTDEDLLCADDGLFMRLIEEGLIDDDIRVLTKKADIVAADGVREATPSYARSDKQRMEEVDDFGNNVQYKYSESVSTDANTFIPTEIARAMSVEQRETAYRAINAVYTRLTNTVLGIADEAKNDGILIRFTEYGHDNVTGINYHRRATGKAPEGKQKEFKAYWARIKQATQQLLTDLKELSAKWKGIIHVDGGEKGQMSPASKTLATPEAQDATARRIMEAHPAFTANVPQVWRDHIAAMAERAVAESQPYDSIDDDDEPLNTFGVDVPVSGADFVGLACAEGGNEEQD